MAKEFINGQREIFMLVIGLKAKCKVKGIFIGNKVTLIKESIKTI